MSNDSRVELRQRAEQLLARAVREEATRAERLNLWLAHSNGEHVSILYGDDGEMQCNHQSHGAIDFKRDPLEVIVRRLTEEATRAERERLFAEILAIAKDNEIAMGALGIMDSDRAVHDAVYAVKRAEAIAASDPGEGTSHE